MDKHKIKSKTNYRQVLEENTLVQKGKQANEQRNKQTKNKQTNEDEER
jgi:hypothetical protein